MTLTFMTEDEAQTFLDIWGLTSPINYNTNTTLFTVEA